MKKYIPRIIFWVLVVGIIANILSVLAVQKDKYLSTDYNQRYPELKKTYENSQYVSKHPIGSVPDEVVNAYAGGALIRGVNPTYIIADTPPLGKYLIGISTILFNNENIVTLLAAIVSLFLLFLIGRHLFKSKTAALLLVFLVSSERIFLNQLIYTPLYDMIQLMFLLSSFYFFIKGLERKNYFLLFAVASIFLGCFISTKFFATGVTLLGAYFLTTVLRRDWKRTVAVVATSPLAVLVLLFSYIQAFIQNPNIHEFVGIQKWVFIYHKSQLILPLSVWPLILFNQWHVWFGDKPVIHDGQWSISWPVVTMLSFITILLYLIKKIKHTIQAEPFMIWIVLYFLFFSFGQITSRYFVILIPVLYVVSLFGVIEILIKNKNFKKWYEDLI